MANAFRAQLKRTHRVLVTEENSKVHPGRFVGLDLETGRARFNPADRANMQIRARCHFESGSSRAVTVTPAARIGDLFWLRDGSQSRAASMLTLQVESVAVARLQDMSDSDALAEGSAFIPSKYLRTSNGRMNSPREWFAAFWDEYAPEGARWVNNPWVWIYSFKTYGRNVDSMHMRCLRYNLKQLEEIP